MGDMAYMADDEGSEEETPYTMETWPVVRGPLASWLLHIKDNLAEDGIVLRDMTAVAELDKELTKLRFGYNLHSVGVIVDIMYRIISSLSDFPLQAPDTGAHVLMHHAISNCIARQDIKTTEEHGLDFLDGISILNMLHILTEEDEPPLRHRERLYMWRTARVVRKWMSYVGWRTCGE